MFSWFDFKVTANSWTKTWKAKKKGNVKWWENLVECNEIRVWRHFSSISVNARMCFIHEAKRRFFYFKLFVLFYFFIHFIFWRCRRFDFVLPKLLAFNWTRCFLSAAFLRAWCLFFIEFVLFRIASIFPPPPFIIFVWLAKSVYKTNHRPRI